MILAGEGRGGWGGGVFTTCKCWVNDGDGKYGVVNGTTPTYYQKFEYLFEGDFHSIGKASDGRGGVVLRNPPPPPEIYLSVTAGYKYNICFVF